MRTARRERRPAENPAEHFNVRLRFCFYDGCFFGLWPRHDGANSPALGAPGSLAAAQVSRLEPMTGIDETDPVHHFHQVDYRASPVTGEADEPVCSSAGSEGWSRVVMARQPAPAATAPGKFKPEILRNCQDRDRPDSLKIEHRFPHNASTTGIWAFVRGPRGVGRKVRPNSHLSQFLDRCSVQPGGFVA